MKSRILFSGHSMLWPLLLVAGSFAPQADASRNVTLIEMGDLHGTLVPHAAVIKNIDGSERQVASAGGLARLKTVVNSIRADNPEAVLLSAGDLTHGSAETLFTVGDAMMKAMNAFDIDVFTPGNWDFGYGPAVFRNRFTSFGPKPGVPPNIAVMAGYIGCDDGSCVEEKGITRFTLHDLKRKGATDSDLPATISTGNTAAAAKVYDIKKLKARPTK